MIKDYKKEQEEVIAMLRAIAGEGATVSVKEFKASCRKIGLDISSISSFHSKEISFQQLREIL
jgi:hypothetical protein